MSSRPGGPLTRTAIAVALGIGVLAAQAVQPISAANAQTLASANSLPTHRAKFALPKNRPPNWSAATAKPTTHPQKTLNAAALRAQAIANAATTNKIASYRVSPAMVTFLTKGLGMPLDSARQFTGVRSGSTLKVSLPAPEGLRIGLPTGIRQPAFSRSTLVIDPATGAATLTASAKASGGTLNVTIPDAASATLAGLTSKLTLPTSVLGETVTLSGPLSYQPGKAASASLSGHLPTADDLGHGVAELDADTSVTLSPADGLRVTGPASLGPARHRLQADVSGTITGASGWTLTVTAVRGGTPLAGLALTPDASGTVTQTRGTVSYDVQARTARPWTSADGVTVAGTVDFSNKLPNGRLVPAPGIAGSTPWIDVTGTVTASGVATHGTAAVNLASGKGLLTSSGETPVTLKSRSGKLIHDDAGFRASLGVTGAGHVTVSLPADLSTWTPRKAAAVKPAGDATARSVTNKTMSAAADASASYTLSGPVYNFITNSLHIPLGSATLTGTLSGSTLTLSASAPTALPAASLPSWIPNPSYASTQISVDESTDTVTLSATAGTGNGESGTLTVTIANASTSDLSDGTDVTGSLDLTGVPFANGSASLTFTLGYTGGALSASLSGTVSGASFGSGLVTIPSATLTLASGSGVSLTGSAVINPDPTDSSPPPTVTVAVTGTITDLSDWSLQVSDANASVWQPMPGLDVTPDFSGSIADAAGQVSFDLDLVPASSGQTNSWTSQDGASVSITSLEVSNQAPGSGASCSAVNEGDLWIGIGGNFAYTPAGLTGSASGCFDLTSDSATITSDAAGSLTSQFGSGLPFTVTAAGFTASLADGPSGEQYSLTAQATVQITEGVDGDPSFFNVGVSLSNSGIVAGLSINDLSSFPGLSELGLSGSGALYVSTQAINGFDPADTLGMTGQPTSIDLPAGLSVSADFTVPTSVTSAFQQFIPGFYLSSGSTVQTMASLSTSGFSLDLGEGYGTGTGGLTVFDSGGSALFLNGFNLKLLLSSQIQISLSGDATLELPPMTPNGSTSTVGVLVSTSFNADSLTLSLGFDIAGWNNALGVSGLNMQDFGGTLGLTLESGVPTPTLGIYAENIVLPTSWANTIGVVQGSEISFDVNFSLTQPVLGFDIVNPYGDALTPLAIDPSLPSSVVDTFLVSQASFEFAPDGGVTPAGDTLRQGVSVIFDATIDHVSVDVNAAVNLSSPSVTEQIGVGSFSIGSASISGVTFNLNLSPTNAGFGFTGAISDGNYSFSATISLAVGTSMNGANISLSVTGGLPSYFSAGATLTGSISDSNGDNSADNSGDTISAQGSGWLYAAGQYLGPVSFYLSTSGSMSWSDYSNSIVQLAQFFISNAGLSFNEAVQALEQFGYQAYDIINALGQIGQYSSQVGDSLANAFGFSTTYYHIWNETSAGELLVLDVDGGSTSPSAPVITWTMDADTEPGQGYNQDWEFIESPYAPGWYNIVNRNSGQCLTVEYNTSTPGNPLVQYPCNGGSNQLWNMGSIELDIDYAIPNALDGQVIDIQGGDPWPGGILDQWPYAGGWNQWFWLTNAQND